MLQALIHTIGSVLFFFMFISADILIGLILFDPFIKEMRKRLR